MVETRARSVSKAALCSSILVLRSIDLRQDVVILPGDARQQVDAPHQLRERGRLLEQGGQVDGASARLVDVHQPVVEDLLLDAQVPLGARQLLTFLGQLDRERVEFLPKLGQDTCGLFIRRSGNPDLFLQAVDVLIESGDIPEGRLAGCLRLGEVVPHLLQTGPVVLQLVVQAGCPGRRQPPHIRRRRREEGEHRCEHEDGREHRPHESDGPGPSGPGPAAVGL